MRDWSKINKGSISNDRTLLLEFTQDFNKHLGKLNIGCKQCISDAYNRLIKFKPNEMGKVNDCDYRLKSKYEGIFFEGNPIRNGDLTNEVCHRLLGLHKAGISLFDRFPNDISNYIGVDPDGETQDKDLTYKELSLKYPEISVRSKKAFLAELEKLNSNNQEEE